MYRFLFVLCCLCTWACSHTPPLPLSPEGTFDTWISGGMVVDGSGQKAYAADLLIQADTIAFVGKVDSSRSRALQRIDARGKLISPGFIDPHSHGDPLRRPVFANFLAQGVTSISLGQDGYSAPFRDFGAWMDSVEQQQPGVNIIPFVGHGTLRELSGVRFKKDVPKEGLDSMLALLSDALQAGAWGMSTGLEYTPGRFAGEEELTALARRIGQADAMIMSHVRNEDDPAMNQSLAELLLQGQHCRVHVSHMKSVYGQGVARAEQLLQLMDSARTQGLLVTADIYPYTASYTTIGIVFPDWARPPVSFSRIRRLKRQQLTTYLEKRITQRNGPEATLFATAPYTGKTLAQVAEEKQKSFTEVLIDDIGPRGASAAYFVMNEDLQKRLMQDSLVMIGSDGSPTMFHPRGYGSFTKVLETHVRQDSLFSLEEAIRKMTSLTAQTLGMPRRGLIESGYIADLAIFTPEALQAKATFAKPHQLSEGMDLVLIRGQIAFQEGEAVTPRFGKVLRKKSSR
ncbi:MAG: amidohydrolase family protein [Bacteroidota bacterium]